MGFGAGESRVLQATVAVFASILDISQVGSLDEEEARRRVREAAKESGIPRKQRDKFADTCWQIMAW